MLLEIAIIRLNGGTQPRAELNIETIGEYSERMKAGEKFPPITVFFDGKEYWLADGFHRIGAAMRLQNTTIEAEVIQGTQSDAQWFSYSVNKAHGMRRTNEDKERVVKSALQHPNAVGQSNYQIAQHCGVSESMVRKYRNSATPTDPTTFCAQSEKTKPSSPANSRPRTGRDGRTINTARIGKAKSKPSRLQKAAPISRNAHLPKIGHSQPLRMIPLQFCPDNPHTAAATLIQHFPRTFLETLVQLLTDHLTPQGENP